MENYTGEWAAHGRSSADRGRKRFCSITAACTPEGVTDALIITGFMPANPRRPGNRFQRPTAGHPR